MASNGVRYVLGLALLLIGPRVWAGDAVDLLLRGGTLYDGSGTPGVVGDVAVAAGKIVAVGKCPAGKVGRTIDCTGLVVAPGFIDLHTHCDPTGSLEKRRNLNYLTQGCTTVMTGNCGGGPVDIGAYYDRLDRDGCGTNVLCLVPHGSVRAGAMGGGNRAPTADELQRMQQGVERGMRAGAWGMSTGLIYTPGMFSKTDELIALAAVVARHHGLYVTHLRNEAQDLLPSVHEALRIGRAAGLPVHVSHFKAVGPRSWGSVRQAAAAIDEARAAGQRVTADQYPYIATSTGLSAVLFPATEIPGGLRDFARRMETDADYRRAVRQVVERRLPDNPRIVIAGCKRHPDWVGKSLEQIAAELNTDQPGAAIRIETDGGASVVRFVLSEQDVRWVMQVPWWPRPRTEARWCPARAAGHIRAISARSPARSASMRSANTCSRWPKPCAAPRACRPTSWGSPTAATSASARWPTWWFSIRPRSSTAPRSTIRSNMPPACGGCCWPDRRRSPTANRPRRSTAARCVTLRRRLSHPARRADDRRAGLAWRAEERMPLPGTPHRLS